MRDKFHALGKELTKKLWNMRAAVTPNVIGVTGKVSKGLVQKLDNLEIRGEMETGIKQ